MLTRNPGAGIDMTPVGLGDLRSSSGYCMADEDDSDAGQQWFLTSGKSRFRGTWQIQVLRAPLPTRGTDLWIPTQVRRKVDFVRSRLKDSLMGCRLEASQVS